MQALLARFKPGDTLVVWEVDRASLSLIDVMLIVKDLEARGIVFRGLTGNFDTSTAVSRMTLGILATFAQFERDMIKERTAAGLKTANAAGRYGGCPQRDV